MHIIDKIRNGLTLMFEGEGANPPAVPATPPPAAPVAPVSPSPTSTPPLTPRASEFLLPPGPKKNKNLISPRAALGLAEDPGKEVSRMQKALDKKVDATTTPLPPKTPAEAPKPAAAVPPVPPVVPPVVAPVAPATPAAPAEPIVPALIKIGDTEYTAEQLQEMVNKSQTPPAPVAPAAPAAVAPTQAQLDAEKKARDEETKTLDETFVKKHSATYATGLVSEADLDKILLGGEAGAAHLAGIVANAATKARLDAQKQLVDTLNPILKDMESRISATKPVLENLQQIEQYQAEHDLITRFPDLTGRQDTFRAVAHAALSQFPQQMNQMTKEQFQQYVYDNTKTMVERFGGKLEAPAPVIPAAPTPAVPAVAVPAPVVPAAPAAPKPPGGTKPGAPLPPGKLDKQSAMAHDLRNV